MSLLYSFKKISDSAKLLYGLMLDRMSLSIRNGWLDDDNRAYIFFTTNDVMEQMCCGTEKATKMLTELDSEKGIGLIERVKHKTVKKLSTVGYFFEVRRRYKNFWYSVKSKLLCLIAIKIIKLHIQPSFKKFVFSGN